MDWIAQAQLVTAIGPAKALKLRDLGLRNVFDLEAAVQEDQLCAAVRGVLFGPEHAISNADAVRTIVNSMVRNLHVQRLRQVWNAILMVVTPYNEGRPPRASWPLIIVNGKGVARDPQANGHQGEAQESEGKKDDPPGPQAAHTNGAAAEKQPVAR